MRIPAQKICSLLVFVLNSYGAFSQGSVIDSLQKVLQAQRDDSTKVNTLNDLSLSCWQQNDYENAMQYAEKALSLSEKINFRRGKAKAYYNKALVYTDQYNYPKAIESYNSELKIWEESLDTFRVAWSQVMIARVYFRMENYPEALKLYYGALTVFEEKDDKRSIAITRQEIGGINAEQNNNAEALENYQAALKKFEELGMEWGVAACYSSMADIHLQDNNYSEALRKDSIALKIYLEFKNIGNTGKRNGAIVLGHIGNIFEKQGNIAAVNGQKKGATGKYTEASKKYSKAMEMFEEVGDKEGIAALYMNLGNINIGMRNLTVARKFLEKSILIADSIASKWVLKDTYRSLTTLDSLQGNYAQAFEYYKMYRQYGDSLINEENTEKIVQTQMKYESDKKEALAKAEQEKKDTEAAKELQRQKLMRNGFVGGFTVVLLFAAVFFTQRNKIKKGKKLSDELLLNILPSETAEELKQTGTAKAKSYDEVTVMFTDFKNFTQAAERLSAEKLVSEINYYFSEFDKIISKHNIEKIKTIGDSYMCAGGLPVANKTNAQDIVRAALDIQQLMHQHRQQREQQGQPFFEIRIGVHTGPVVAGIVGIKKFAYDIWGDTVNIASRMESSGEPGKINISGSTYQSVKDKFHCKYRGKVQAKNKGEIDMYFVETVV